MDRRCYEFIPAANTWFLTAFSLDTVRAGAGAVMLDEDRWMVAGGGNGEDYALDSSIIYKNGTFFNGMGLLLYREMH